MTQETTKVRVIVELKNGDYHKVECSSIEIGKLGIQTYGDKAGLGSININDVSLLTISIESENAKEKLTLRLVKEPKENL